MPRDNWTEEQITIVLYEYCRNPFGQFSSTKKFVEELGKLIGRSSAAIVRKVGNLASFDPLMKARGVGGLGHTAKLDEIVWNKYYGTFDIQGGYNKDMTGWIGEALIFTNALTDAEMDAPLPRWQTMTLPFSGSRFRYFSASCDTKSCEVPWKP